VRDLAVGMDTRVGATGAVDANFRPIDPFQGIFQNALDGARQGAVRARRLQLPAFEESPQISQLELQPHVGDYGRAPHGPRAIVGPMPAQPTLIVTEIFRSLQGESSFAGLPCTFVRLTGCSLRCVWCDSAYAFHGGKATLPDELLAEVERLGAPLVELTGGEPLEQEGFYELSAALCDRGFTVLVETGGHIPLDRVDPRVVKIVDIKCPGSGMQSRNDLDNLKRLGPKDEVKFVVADRRDFDWAIALIQKHRLDETHTILISPVFEGAVSKVSAEVAEWVRDSKRKLRLNLQVHKLLWGDVPGR
jgi:7-carboxy-7-deazaguanine synthase